MESNKVNTLIEIMKKEFEEFEKTGKIQRAKNLKNLTNAHFNHSNYPMYFTGNPDAKFVLVHLNPKQKDSLEETYQSEKKYSNFEEYYNFHRNFGKVHYGQTSERTHKSKFDHKQIRFIKPFNVIKFDNSKDEFYNLEKVIDDKFQLELIPFGSDEFKSSAIKLEAIESYVDILLETIANKERDYIIFCGKIFEKALAKYIVSKEDFEFNLPKTDGTTAKNHSKFSRIILEFKGKKIKAGIAQSFAQQGLNMTEYGKKCHELYNQ